MFQILLLSFLPPGRAWPLDVTSGASSKKICVFLVMTEGNDRKPAQPVRFPRYPAIRSGPAARLWWRMSMMAQVVRAMRQYGSLKTAGEVLKVLRQWREKFLGDKEFSRTVSTGHRFYWNVHEPGFPSVNQTRNSLGEMHRVKPVPSPGNRLRILMIGITNKCPIRCRHCYEDMNLGKPDMLGTEDYKSIIGRFLEHGVGQVHFGGGEPVARFDVLADLVAFFHKRSEMWLATSGYNLDREKAFALKRAGLTGAAISVDHFDPGLHNRFRGSEKSFEWAIDATRYCREAGLILCWSVCVTPEFLSLENLHRYAGLAGKHGAHFIQLLEPVPVGSFSGNGQMVLSKSQLDLLDDFYVSYNTDRQYRKMPLVTWAGYHQRRRGCLAAGDRYLYVDANGCLHSCPFCRNDRRIDIRQEPFEEALAALQKERCMFRVMEENQRK